MFLWEIIFLIHLVVLKLYLQFEKTCYEIHVITAS